MTGGRPRVLLALALMMAFALPAFGQEEPITLMSSSSTTSQSAVLAAFLTSLDDGAAAASALSVSNILGSPIGSGFPGGGNESGPLTIYLFNGIGTVYTFSTADHPDVGSGTDIEGNLDPGATYTVNLSEILQALFPDRVPADRDFVGYGWIVADFDAVAGTFFNFFPLVGATQSFQMQPTGGGIPVDTGATTP